MNHCPNPRRRALVLLSAVLALPALHCAAATPGVLPGNSVYQFRPPLTDADGAAFDIASLRGQPALVAMFYASCDKVCPMIFESVHATLRALPQGERDRVRVLMVSFDPARDTTEVLKRTFEAHGCDAHWTLARTDESNARKLAALLGVQYRRLSDGEFNHSSTVELLDAEGRITARTGKLGSADASFVKAVRSSLAAAT